MIANPSKGLAGDIRVPGDKSISHRALLIGALSVGETVIKGLLEGEDVARTREVLGELGVSITGAGGEWRLHGLGIGGLRTPGGTLDMGNSGTAARLLMGLLAGQPMTARLDGDGSLGRRPMGRVMEPLELMGARFRCDRGPRLPLTITGTAGVMPIDYRLPVASAQVKSAILLAGLHAPGITCVHEPWPSRDHTERMLAWFGADVEVEGDGHGGRRIRLRGQPELTARPITVPGDPSSSAFPLVAALITQGSAVTVRGVGANKLRLGLFRTLVEMGAELTMAPVESAGGEPMADITAGPSRLRGTHVPASRAPSMIDEYPLLAVAAAGARGTTVLNGLGELRVKESDRLAAIAAGLSACGVTVEAGDDRLVIHGCDGPPPGGAQVAARGDHRIAMAFLVLGLGAQSAVAIDDGRMIDTSFPGFAELLTGLGGAIEVAGGTGDRR